MMTQKLIAYLPLYFGKKYISSASEFVPLWQFIAIGSITDRCTLTVNTDLLYANPSPLEPQTPVNAATTDESRLDLGVPRRALELKEYIRPSTIHTKSVPAATQVNAAISSAGQKYGSFWWEVRLTGGANKRNKVIN